MGFDTNDIGWVNVYVAYVVSEIGFLNVIFYIHLTYTLNVTGFESAVGITKANHIPGLKKLLLAYDGIASISANVDFSCKEVALTN